MKKLIHIIYEKNASIKMIVCILFIIIFSIIYNLTNYNFPLFCLIPFSFWLLTYLLISFIYAWIINPISWLIKKIKK